MALQLFIGKSGSGKSNQMYQQMVEEADKHPDKNYVVLVPEQFTMQTQKELVTLNPKKGILNIDVLSFQRLAYRILDETGSNRLPVLDETGKTFVVRKVAEDHKEQLALFGKSLNRIGYVEEMKSFLSELIQYGISPDKLKEMIEQNRQGSQIRLKLEDMQCVYQAFRHFMEEHYITAEELPELLSCVMDQSTWLTNCTFLLDGFTGFTPLQKKVVEKLLLYTEDVWVAVTADPTLTYHSVLPEYHLFHTSSKVIVDLQEMAALNHITVKPPVLCKGTVRFINNKPLMALEQNLFRSRQKAYLEPQDQVTLHICKNPLEEVKFAAQQIRRLVMQEGYRYRDVAVVVADVETYMKYFDRIFYQYEIPCFIDYKKSIMENPVIEFMNSLVDMVSNNFQYDAVMRYLRSGFVNLSQETVDQMENYILAAGIRGKKKWNEEWVIPIGHMSEAELEQLNQNRTQFMQEIQSFISVFSKKTTTVLEKTQELCNIFEKYQIQEKLKQQEQEFIQEQNLSMAKEYAQVYKIVIQTLDKLVEMLGDEKTDAKEYAGLLKAGFSGIKVGIIPPGVDQVIVGDIERSRFKQVKALFFLGVNDGFVPKSISDAGIISGIEREQLKEQGMELAPGNQEQYYLQKFQLYLSLTKLDERLYICYSKNDPQGNASNPSYLIGNIEGIYPSLEVIDEEENSKKVSSIVSERQGLDYLVENWKWNEQEDFLALFQYLEEKELYKNRLKKMLQASVTRNRTTQIDAAIAKVLYKGEIEGSVTRMERYAACAYAHFLQYGLMLRERDHYGFEGLDFGNILHEILQRYAQMVQSARKKWVEIGEEESHQMVEQCLEETVRGYGNVVLFQTARDHYRLERIRRIANRTVWALTKQLTAGKFEPDQAELSFQSYKDIKTQLGESVKLKLRGRIDRTDVYEKDDNLYVKIVDYKTGKQEFKMLKLYYGLQLQLVVYLGEAVKLKKRQNPDKTVIPAGVLYYRIDDPLIERDIADDREQIDKKVLHQLCVDGAILEKNEVLAGMDSAIQDALENGKQAGSDVIPVSIKKDGKLSSRSKTVSEGELNLMVTYAEQKIEDMSTKIINGDVSLNPYKEGTFTACDYCPYHGVCGFQDRGSDMFRELDKEDEAILYAKMKEYCAGKESE